MSLTKSYLSAIVIIFMVFCVPTFGAYGPIPPGYPNAANTGLAGVGLTEGDLTTVTGLQTFSTPGEVIELKNFPDGINIAASNVTVRKCKIGMNMVWPVFGIDVTYGSGIVIEDCTMVGYPNPLNGGQGAGIRGSNYVIRRCNISQYNDGVKTQSYTITEDNYIHDLIKEEYAPGLWTHNDAAQCSGCNNTIVRRNTLRMFIKESTACIMIGTTSNVYDVLYEKNLFGGGSACVNINEKDGYTIWDLIFRRNVWELGTYNSHLYGNTELATYICNTFSDGSYLPENVACDYVVAGAGTDQVVLDTDGDANETVTLDGSGSYYYGQQIDYGAHIDSYVWEANGIEIATGVTADVNLGLGQHLITLEVTDSNGLTDTDTVEIIVAAAPGSLPAAQIEFDANSYGSAAFNVNSFSWSHTIGDGNDRALVVGLAMQDIGSVDMNVASITYDGVSMTTAPNSIATETTGNVIRSQLFYMLESDLPSAGTYSINVVFDGAVIESCGGAVSLKNVSQQPPEAVVTNTASSELGGIYTSLNTQTGYSWLVDVIVAAKAGSFDPNNDPCMTKRWGKKLIATTGAGGTKPVPYVGYTKTSWLYSTGAARMAHSVAAFAPIIGQLKAYNPMPQDEEGSVSTDAILSWSPGDYAVFHDVFLGTNFDDVNEAYRHFCDLDGSGRVDFGDIGVMVSQWLDAEGSADLDGVNGVDFIDFAILGSNWAEFGSLEYAAHLTVDANSFDPCGLDSAQTYFWRVDEVNDFHQDSPWTGDVWRFTTE